MRWMEWQQKKIIKCRCSPCHLHSSTMSIRCDSESISPRLPFDEILIFMLRWCFDRMRCSDDFQSRFFIRVKLIENAWDLKTAIMMPANLVREFWNWESSFVIHSDHLRFHPFNPSSYGNVNLKTVVKTPHNKSLETISEAKHWWTYHERHAFNLFSITRGFVVAVLHPSTSAWGWFSTVRSSISPSFDARRIFFPPRLISKLNSRCVAWRCSW